jgi:hypothetical protein
MGEKRAYERPRVIRLSSGWAAEGASSCDAPGSGDAGYCETGNTAGYICVSTGNTAVVGCDGAGNAGSVVPI